MNFYLYKSSLFVTIIYFFQLWLFDIKCTYTALFTIFGIITSLLNHGYSSTIYKYLDRITIVFVFLLYLYNLQFYSNNIVKYVLLYLLLLSPILYFLSKLNENKKMQILYHSYAHLNTLLFLSIYNI